MDLKTCSACHESFGLNNFYQKGKYADARCKACVLQAKSQKYRSKAKLTPDKYIKVIAVPFEQKNISSEKDLVWLLESFILEELGNEKRTAC